MMGADAGGNLALVGKGGRNGRFLADIFPPLPAFSQHFPPFPTFSHFIFILWPSGAGWEMEGWIIAAVGGAEWEDAAGRGADLCGKKCGLLREGSRKFAKVRTEQARKSAMFGFPSPPQVRCPKWVVRLRETWSHCYGWDSF